MYKFTGKERDSESGLDNFGKRYNASSMGRFMTPDPIMIMKQKLRDPQQWNMYSYAANNPMTFTDPTGQYVWGLAQACLHESAINRLPQSSRFSKAGHHRPRTQETFLTFSTALCGSFTTTGPASP